MCGIVGYIGSKNASPILMEGLERLSYRGYDSAGVAVIGPDGKIGVRKAKGRLDASLSDAEVDYRRLPDWYDRKRRELE